MRNPIEDQPHVTPEGLSELRLEAPQDTLERFRKRASLLQGTQFVLGRQFYGFWIVLNTFLKLIFKVVKVPVTTPNRGQAARYRRLTQNAGEINNV